MEKYIDILMDRVMMMKNWKKYIVRIYSVVKSILPDARLYVFGSFVKGEAVGGSDVDVLIVSENIPKSNFEKAKIKVKIEELANLPLHHPFEFHIVSTEEARWYFEKIRELKEINMNSNIT